MSDSTRSSADTLRQIISLIIILGAGIAANILGMAMGETDTGNVANTLFNDSVLFFPATYVFATIWPIIYLGLMGLAVHQALPTQRQNPRYRRSMYVLSGNLILNALWVWIFGSRMFVLSLFTIVPILASAVWTYRLLDIGKGSNAGRTEKILATAVGIYSAWLCVATIANVALVLASTGWSGFGLSNQAWTIIMLTAGMVLAVFLSLRFKDVTFALVFAYAYIGIAVRRMDQFSSLGPMVALSLVGAAMFLLFSLIYSIRTGRRNDAG